MTIDWLLSELRLASAYGNLWLVSRIDKQMHCLKMGKRKSNFYCTTKPKKFLVMPQVSVGDLLFEDKNGQVQHMRPDGEFAKQIQLALEKL